MTKEEIEAAREVIMVALNNYRPFVDLCADIEVAAAEKALDALCAVAGREDNLAGRRARIKDGPIREGEVGKIIGATTYIIEFSDDEEDWDDFQRDDFELLEDDNA